MRACKRPSHSVRAAHSVEESAPSRAPFSTGLPPPPPSPAALSSSIKIKPVAPQGRREQQRSQTRHHPELTRRGHRPGPCRAMGGMSNAEQWERCPGSPAGPAQGQISLTLHEKAGDARTAWLRLSPLVPNSEQGPYSTARGR